MSSTLGHRKAYAAKCKTLIQDGADPNAQLENGITPLHLAAAGNHVETCELLIQQGANVNAKDKDGYTPPAPTNKVWLHRCVRTAEGVVGVDGLRRTTIMSQ